ncbi:MAG: formate dehydrogenase accessory sulfurtransferase FdhD [Candidatus Eremiobacteraeota bacterium]|nr:formate dehydrogenase accessory sulfurtransferase FdhD [Candidatus Eremiobacteraeota bacterium]MBC5801538.1 formate dehydrogenase accessory sulfurtransferase FdhD [Candidatus Eremiobacteraeota bacterium]MBC5822833.1 formate dehydrogenase accessory sulfurtransferase FdhD [Candidatus Eremiobacteraeota bacterium]
MAVERGNLATRPGPTCEASIVAFEDGRAAARFDRLATEEPLEIRLQGGGEKRTVAITMRTPGNDFELAAGFLHNEGVLPEGAALRRISYCLAGELDADQHYNIVNVELGDAALPNLDALERHFTMTSACGICGKASLDALRVRGFVPLDGKQRVAPQMILTLPERLRERQGVFAKTGGLHAAALFDARGSCLAAREDVGRHNAVDKLVGWALFERRLPLNDCILMVSGRASYEIVQKALSAGIPIVCSVSAPSSLAVTLANEFGLTLAGFVRDARFNVYAHAHRITGAQA